MESYKGEFLMNYFRRQRGKIRERSEIIEPEVLELKTWSLERLQDSILLSYEKSLENSSILAATSAGNIAQLLNTRGLTPEYLFTVFDLLAYRVLKLYSNSSFFTSEFNRDEFNWENEGLLAPTSEFSALSIPEIDLSGTKALRIYQELESVNLAAENPMALIFWTVQRLKLVKNRADSEKINQNYLEALEKLSSKYSDEKLQAFILYEIAEHYYTVADKKKIPEDFKHPNYLKNAVEIINKIEKEFPNTLSARDAVNLKLVIEKPAMDAKIPAVLSIGDPGRIFLSYKNLDTLNYKIIPVSKDYPARNDIRGRDSIIHAFARKYKDSAQVILPAPKDYKDHSTEVAFMGKKPGTYLVYFYENEYNFSYGFFQATNIAVTKTDYKNHHLIHAMNRKSGENLENLTAEVYKNDSLEFRRETDRNGELKLNKEDKSYSREKLIFHTRNDTLFTELYSGYYRNSEETAFISKTLFFLDRSIYRPGQKVYFKGVLLQNENDSTKTVANEFVPVYIENPNGKKVAELQFKTNEYGSFSGNFVLPKKGITGHYRIYTDIDPDAESEFWNRLQKQGRYVPERTYFSVEEYKRPTFKISLDSIRKSYKPQDTIRVTGNVKSFMGAPLSNVKVKYEIKRERLNGWRYYHEKPVVIKTDSVQTDDNGNFQLIFIAKAEKEALTDPDLLYNYDLSASATDITGETQEAFRQIRIGNKNLKAYLQLEKNVVPGDTLEINLETRNPNYIKIDASGNLKIFKLKSPNRILKNRLWEAPEYNLISEDEFTKLFPDEPYKDNLSPEEWPRAEMVYETPFRTDGSLRTSIPIRHDWEDGKYLVEINAQSDRNKVTTQRIFQITSPNNQYAPENERLLVSLGNEDARKDGYARVIIQTAYKDLNLKLVAFNGNKAFFKEFIKVDGSRKIEIPVEKIKAREITIRVSGVRNNAVLREELYVPLKTEENSLNITTKTFRNKIRPGLEETWGFSIEDKAGKHPDAEILATMYDVSLNQFIYRDWRSNPYFYYRMPIPRFDKATVGVVTRLSNNFPRLYITGSRQFFFDSFNNFGFYFSEANSSKYRAYLNHKKREKERKNFLIGNIRGKVIDENGLPLPRVGVLKKNTSKGTVTNMDGWFALDAKKGDVLIISAVGYQTREYQVEEEKEIYLVLTPSSQSLNEVVTVGYAKNESRRQVTGSSVPVSESISPKIRGTEGPEKNPIYIVDGKPVKDFDMKSREIANVEVLKGPEAVDLYGSSAKDGAILITTKDGLARLSQVDTRSNLKETAFFFPGLRSDENGRLEFSFTSPEKLTSWKLRLLAHTRNWNTGTLQKIVSTQKELNISPNPPRFLREGDSLTFKAKVNNLSSGSMTGNAILKLYDAVTMQPLDSVMGNIDNTRSFHISASKSDVVSWKLYIPEEVPAVLYRILGKTGDFSDGEENLLPVLKNRILVKESIPFFVNVGETEDYTFESLKNNHSKSLEQHQFSVEYTSNPAWYAIQSLPYLMEGEYECSDQVFSRIFANSLGNKIVTSQPKIALVFREWEKDSSLTGDLEKNEKLKSLLLSKTPWVRQAQSESAQKKRVAELFNSDKTERETKENLDKLLQMQNPSGAFPWFPGGRDNFYITRYIVAGFGHLQKLDINVDAQQILPNSIKYLDGEFIKTMKESKRFLSKKDFYASDFALHYLHARSYHLAEFPLSEELKPVVAKVLESQKKNWLSNGVYTKGILALVLNKFGERDLSREILKSLKGTAIYSQELGMYWKENRPSWLFGRDPLETQAMLMEAFSEILQDEKSVQEMKIWLLQHKRTNHWATTKSTTAACYALLMKGEDWLNISEKTEIKIGDKNIVPEKLSETQKAAGIGYFKLNWDGEEINDSFANIRVINNNSTPGYGGAYWQYFEDLDKIEDTSESPLEIEKELYLNQDGKLHKITAQSIETGDLVTVRMVINSKADMDFIHLKDMRASGLEPVDVLSGYEYQDNIFYYQSTRDAATHFFFDNLNKGTYVLEYDVRANNAGNYSNGITKIESMYAPEFSAHTKAINVKINEEAE